MSSVVMDLVECDLWDKPHAGHLPDQPRMRQDQADQQPFLLAGRAQLGRHVLLGVPDDKIGPVRAGQGSSSRLVERPGRGPKRHQLQLQRR